MKDDLCRISAVMFCKTPCTVYSVNSNFLVEFFQFKTNFLSFRVDLIFYPLNQKSNIESTQ